MKNALFFLAAILLLTVSCTDNQIQLNGDEPDPSPPAFSVSAHHLPHCVPLSAISDHAL